MTEFRKEQITEHIYRIYGAGDACMYFIQGSEDALLIDTAYGLGDLKSYIDGIAKTPYRVVITHGHADHANGIGQFSEVYMNRRDIELYYSRSDIQIRRRLLKKTIPDIDQYPDSAFVPQFQGTFLDLEEGMRFDLGVCSAEVYAAPGHTEGMMVLLVPEDRVCLFGDACGENTFLFRPEASTVYAFRETLHKLLAMQDRYDRILRQHGSCESPKSLVEENLRTADLILAGKDDHIPFDYDGFHAFFAHKTDISTGKRVDGVSGNIVYSEDKIR